MSMDLRSRKTGRSITPTEALRQIVSVVVAAGAMARNLRSYFRSGSSVSTGAGSVDDAIQALIAAELLARFEGASFHTPETKTPLVHLFPSDGTFVWGLNLVHGTLYRNGSKEYDVRLVLYERRTGEITGTIAARPQMDDVFVGRKGESLYRVGTDPVTGAFERRDSLKLSTFGNSTPRIVLIPERFKAQARILKEAGLEVVFETSEMHSPMNLFDRRICGALSVDAPVYGTGANGFLARHAGGYWDHAPYIHETRTFPWSIAAADERIGSLLRAVVSAHALPAP